MRGIKAILSTQLYDDNEENDQNEIVLSDSSVDEDSVGPVGEELPIYQNSNFEQTSPKNMIQTENEISHLPSPPRTTLSSSSSSPSQNRRNMSPRGHKNESEKEEEEEVVEVESKSQIRLLKAKVR